MMKGYDDNQKSLYLHSQLRKAIGVARGGRETIPPQIFRKYSHFVL